MIASRLLAQCILYIRLASGLKLEAIIHYPQNDSAVDRCGFKFRIATSIIDSAQSEPAHDNGRDSCRALLELSDTHLYAQVLVVVVADHDASIVFSPECQAVCPRLGPQGQAVQLGSFLQTEPLSAMNTVEIWPVFCRLDVGVTQSTFYSEAIGREVVIKSRVPAAYLENGLPRPGHLMPPIFFRFNSEWYWEDNAKHFNTWHDLMVAGDMEPFVAAEVYIQGVDWNAWANQPIYTTQKLNHKCGKCEPELKFICDSWQSSGYFGYVGGNHSFGSAVQFYDNIYDQGLPQVLSQLPQRLDKTTLRVGAWGYCIGGLAAWNAILSRPERFNFAYLGSPAVDFDCGDPLLAADSFTWGVVRPKIYIDAGGGEGTLMTRQTLLLFRKLQERGLVEGKDIFYTRAEFGTHQGRSLLRRAHVGLLVLFGTGTIGQKVYVPASQQITVAAVPEQKSVMGMQSPHSLVGFFLDNGPCMIMLTIASSIAFFLGRRTAPAGQYWSKPLLSLGS